MQAPPFESSERVWFDLLRREWFHACQSAGLERRLRLPNFALSDQLDRTLGRWDPNTRTIHLSTFLLEGRRWRALVETLRHEMAHQVVSEIFHLDDATHGEPFIRACRMIGADPAPTARPSDLSETAEEPPIVRKIRKLLALGGSPYQHEAEAALRKAQELALKYGVEVTDGDGPVHYVYRLLDRPRKRWPRTTWRVLSICETLHDIRYVVIRLRGPSGSVVEIVGRPASLDLAEYTYHYLVDTGERIWRSYRRQNPGAQGKTAKLSFLDGLYIGFARKLASQRQEIEQSSALATLGDPGLVAFYEARHPRVHSRGPSSCNWDPESHVAGKRAGTELTIHEGLRSEGPGRRLLE